MTEAVIYSEPESKKVTCKMEGKRPFIAEIAEQFQAAWCSGDHETTRA